MLLACKSTAFARQSHCFFKRKKMKMKTNSFFYWAGVRVILELFCACWGFKIDDFRVLLCWKRCFFSRFFWVILKNNYLCTHSFRSYLEQIIRQKQDVSISKSQQRNKLNHKNKTKNEAIFYCLYIAFCSVFITLVGTNSSR